MTLAIVRRNSSSNVPRTMSPLSSTDAWPETKTKPPEITPGENGSLLPGKSFPLTTSNRIKPPLEFYLPTRMITLHAMFYDVHTHVGLEPGFYLRGWWPYAATATDLLAQMDANGI